MRTSPRAAAETINRERAVKVARVADLGSPGVYLSEQRVLLVDASLRGEEILLVAQQIR